MTNQRPLEGLTVARLIDLLSSCPPDRKVYVIDDSMEYPANVVKTDHETVDDGLVVLITWDLR